MNTDLSAAFETCMEKILNGQTLEDALEGETRAEELRPLLQSVLQLNLLQPTAPAASAQSRSRANFLTRAGDLRSPAPRTPWWGRLRLATAVFTFVVMAVVSLVVTGVVSSQSLPGDFLYPVKIQVERAGENLTAGSSNRLVWELTFDQRRSTEVASLLSRGRRESVVFGGTLSHDAAGNWMAADIPLQIPPTLLPEPALLGAYVDVHGFTHPDGYIEVTSLALRLFQISGTIEELQSNSWQVDSVHLTVTPQTRVDAGLAPGMNVVATAIRYAPDTMLALTIRAEKPAASGAQPQPTPAPLRDQTRPPALTETDDTGETPESAETHDTGETEVETQDVEETDTPEEDKTTDTDETPEPEQTHDNSGSNKTDPPDETPDETQTPDDEG